MLCTSQTPAVRQRESGIALMRIFAILLIICSHAVQTLGDGCADYNIAISAATTSPVHPLITMLRYVGVWGNALFFVSSAWFLLDSRSVNGRKIVSILLDVWVVSVLILFAVLAARGGKLPQKMILRSLLPTTFANNWYITCYLLFYPAHTALNKLIAAMTQKTLLLATLVLCILYIGINYIGEFFFATFLMLWLAIYFLLAYIKLYMPELSGSRRANILALLIGLGGNLGMLLLANFLGLKIPFFSDKLLHWCSNYSPFFILSAIAACNLARMATFRSRTVNYISGLSLLIYVIHENLLLRAYYRPMMWRQIYIAFGYDRILLWILLVTAGLFLLSLAAAIVYQLTLRRLTEPLAGILSRRIGACFDRAADKIMRVK